MANNIGGHRQNKIHLTEKEKLIKILKESGHQYLPSILEGGGAVEEKIKFQLYPYRDSRNGRNGTVRVNVRIKGRIV